MWADLRVNDIEVWPEGLIGRLGCSDRPPTHQALDRPPATVTDSENFSGLESTAQIDWGRYLNLARRQAAILIQSIYHQPTMSFDLLRRIVSGKKSRLKDLELGVDLDLCYITNRIIVMGFPASGIQSLYRNPRKDVKRWLEARHGQNYKIYNFCPRTENAYEGSFFNNQVQRFPFPDHHPPPLSMIPLFVHDIDSFLELSSSNVAVIHCKAGKGRSGTMTLCYLLTLAQLPPSSKLKYSLCGPVLINSTPNTDILSEVTTQLSDHPELQASSSNSTTRPDRPLEKASQGAVATLQTGTDSTETNAHNSLQISPTKNLVNLSESDNVACNPSVYDNQMSDLSEEPSKPLNELNLQKLDQEVGGSRVTLMAQRILDLLKFHTAQRMSNPDSSSYGISIPSQRRWIKYWGEVLLGMDARIPLSTHAQVEIMWIKVYVGELASYSNVLKSQTKIAVQLARYKDSYIEDLERREKQLRQSGLFPRSAFSKVDSLGKQVSPAEQTKNGSHVISKNEPCTRKAQGISSIEGKVDWEDSENLLVAFASFGQESKQLMPKTLLKNHPDVGEREIYEHISEPSGGTTFESTNTLTESSLTGSSIVHIEPADHDVEIEQSKNLGSSPFRYLKPVRVYPNKSIGEKGPKQKGEFEIRKAGGVKIDARREILCRILMGSTGKKHAAWMSDVTLFGYLWFLPAFHEQSKDNRKPSLNSNVETNINLEGHNVTCFPKEEIDFLNAQNISKVEICWKIHDAHEFNLNKHDFCMESLVTKVVVSDSILYICASGWMTQEIH
ncbi:hypothetical protein O181_058923 [Austropuccinia psidii MF-1]|uniref:phosphatidylinositol-3,4,5-trisphosphate 3-phosphatase n=1 Tax=Austropuccinia psidii MF-1 TaxID=1389203 RepID=A0A9Q3EHV4_9BASI|nr:hypothetical protein [Austropuccinia psidii MF-1]